MAVERIDGERGAGGLQLQPAATSAVVDRESLDAWLTMVRLRS